MLEGGHGPNGADDVLLYRGVDGGVTGAVHFGTQLVLAADSDDAVDAFAAEARRRPGMRFFVGPRLPVERLWAEVRSWHRPPVLVRPVQPVYVLYPKALVPAGSGEAPAVRQATLADADTVIEHSAQMMLGELGYDPRANRASFGAAVRRTIALGHWWVWTAGDELRFQLNVGPQTAATAQLQGVWTPPAVRGRGYAAAALREIAARLLTRYPTLSLCVNDFNAKAIALYERTGFVPAGEMSTLLFA